MKQVFSTKFRPVFITLSFTFLLGFVCVYGFFLSKRNLLVDENARGNMFLALAGLLVVVRAAWCTLTTKVVIDHSLGIISLRRSMGWTHISKGDIESIAIHKVWERYKSMRKIPHFYLVISFVNKKKFFYGLDYISNLELLENTLKNFGFEVSHVVKPEQKDPSKITSYSYLTVPWEYRKAEIFI